MWRSLKTSDGVQAAIDVAAGEPGEQVGVSLVLGRDGLAAALEPGPKPGELVGGADQPDPDSPRGVEGSEVGGAVVGDPESRVDVPPASAELELRLGYYLSVHCVPSLPNGAAAAALPVPLLAGRAARPRAVVRARHR